MIFQAVCREATQIRMAAHLVRRHIYHSEQTCLGLPQEKRILHVRRLAL